MLATRCCLRRRCCSRGTIPRVLGSLARLRSLIQLRQSLSKRGQRLLTRCLWLSLGFLGMLPAVRAQRVVRLDLDSRDDGQYSFLGPLVRDVEVVSLPESIHMTHEFPIARLGVVRWLNHN